MRRTAKGYIESKPCYIEDKKAWIRRNEPQQQNLPSSTRWRTAAAISSSCSNRCSNSSIATHYRAAAEVHGRCIQSHTRTSCSSVQYIYDWSGQCILLWNRTRCLRNTKRNTNGNNSTQQSSSSSGSSTMYAYKTDFSIAQPTPQSSSYTFLHSLEQTKKGNVTHKKKQKKTPS